MEIDRTSNSSISMRNIAIHCILFIFRSFKATGVCGQIFQIFSWRTYKSEKFPDKWKRQHTLILFLNSTRIQFYYNIYHLHRKLHMWHCRTPIGHNSNMFCIVLLSSFSILMIKYVKKNFNSH